MEIALQQVLLDNSEITNSYLGLGPLWRGHKNDFPTMFSLPLNILITKPASLPLECKHKQPEILLK